MEITTSPYRPAPTPWGRLLVCLAVIAPVSVLVLLPLGLGLERFVISGDSMAGGIDRGSVVFARATPVGDLRVGDVITFRPPPSAGVERMVTHRIVAIGRDGILTQGDAALEPDPWTLTPAEPTLPRKVLVLPWVGYAYLVFVDSGIWLVAAAASAALVLLVAGELARRGRARAGTRGSKSVV